MSKSKRIPVLAPGADKRRIRSVFKNNEGNMRLGWLITFSVMGYFVLDRILFALLTMVFLRLFNAWNVTVDNYLHAPGWAQIVFQGYQGIISVIVSFAILGLSAGLIRLCKISFKNNRSPDRRWKHCLFAFLAASCATFIFYLLFKQIDSYRMEPTAASAHIALIILRFIILALRLFAEALFTKSVLMDGLQERGHVCWAPVFAGVWMILSQLGGIANIISAVNWMFLGLLIGLIYQRYGLWAGFGLRLGWQMVHQICFGFGGSTQTSVCQLYAVSEIALTGGDGGMPYGFGMTILLTAGILLLQKQGIIDCFERLKQKRPKSHNLKPV